MWSFFTSMRGSEETQKVIIWWKEFMMIFFFLYCKIRLEPIFVEKYPEEDLYLQRYQFDINKIIKLSWVILQLSGSHQGLYNTTSRFFYSIDFREELYKVKTCFLERQLEIEWKWTYYFVCIRNVHCIQSEIINNNYFNRKYNIKSNNNNNNNNN